MIIRHENDEEYVIAITNNILDGLSDYLDTFYPDNEKIYLNELPNSCKEHPLDSLLIIHNTARELISVHKVIQKNVPGWITSSTKMRSEHLFDVRSVRLSKDTLRKYIDNTDMGSKVINGQLELNETISELSKYKKYISTLQTRDEILQKRIEKLISLLPERDLKKFLTSQ